MTQFKEDFFLRLQRLLIRWMNYSCIFLGWLIPALLVIGFWPPVYGFG